MEGISLVETAALQSLINEVQGLKDFVAKTAAELRDAKSPYLNVQQASELTGFGKTWLLANKQNIGFSSVGGNIRFKRKDIEEFMDSNYFKTKSPRRKTA